MLASPHPRASCNPGPTRGPVRPRAKHTAERGCIGAGWSGLFRVCPSVGRWESQGPEGGGEPSRVLAPCLLPEGWAATLRGKQPLKFRTVLCLGV